MVSFGRRTAHRDELLEQIRQPLLSRIDRRLAAILAVSIGAHVAIAIAAWLGDPPAERPWFVETHPEEQVFDADQIPDVAMTPPAPVAPAPGIATAIRPVPMVPAHPDKLRTHPVLAPPVNPEALISGLVGASPSFEETSRHAPGKNLADQLAAARDRLAHARVGVDGGEEAPAMTGGTGPDIDAADAPETMAKSDVPPPRIVPDPDPIGPPPPFDVAGIVARLYEAGLLRCYNLALHRDPALHGRVNITFTILTTGGVSRASATGFDDPLDSCIEGTMRRWRFPAKLDETSDYAMAIIFAQH